MKKHACFLIAGLGAVLALSYLARSQGQPPTPKSGGKPAVTETEDTLAIKKAGQSFIKAYLAGDAKAMAAHWTENGEYFADDGTVLRGRATIEKSYAELFAKKAPHTEASIEITSIRFPSKDTAIEEGYFRVRSDKEAPSVSKYSVLHVREGGKWLMALVREWPREGTSLRDLDWLIGTWEGAKGNTTVRTTCEWWGDKNFIRIKIAIKHKDHTRDGFQMIGKDHSTGKLRSWTFDTDGSFGEATWSRDGKKWVQESAGVLEDGSVLAATNIMTVIDNDSFTFQSVERSLDGEEIPDVPPVLVKRVTK
jgi:uncharacterized protein (TIGR02246 family)